MRKKVFLLCFLMLGTERAAGLSEGVMAVSAAASLKTLKGGDFFNLGDIFDPKGGLNLEEVMISVEKDMNNNGAVKVHLVVIYDIELLGELKKKSSEQYFRNVEQLVKDYPDKLKIFEWELVAKERIIPWGKIEYPNKHLQPIAGIVFAKYSGSGEHRAIVPPTYKKMKITFKKDGFHIDYEDKDNKNDESEDK